MDDFVNIFLDFDTKYFLCYSFKAINSSAHLG
jgi:hypothetical protein